MNPDEYREKLENEILDMIEMRLKSGEMTVHRAKEIARYVLDALHPPLSLEEIHVKVLKFDEHFPELSTLVLEEMRNHEERVKKIILDQVHNLLQQNKLDEAKAVLDQNA